MPIACLVLAAAVVVVDVVAGPEASQAERVRTAVQDFSRAVSERNGPEVCDRATARLRAEIAARLPGQSCEQVAASFGVGIDGRVVAAAKPTRVLVRGDVALIPRGSLEAPGGDRLSEAFALQRIHGTWKVSSTGVPPVTPLDRTTSPTD